MTEPLRHRQTKEAETAMFSLQPPRHIPTLPITSISRFGPSPLLVEPDMAGRTGDLGHPLLYYLIGGGQQRLRDGEAEGLGGFEIDDQLEPRRLNNRQVGR